MESKPTKLKIKYESVPERCEICHQSDCFTPSSGHCSRCSALVVWKPSSLQNNFVQNPRISPIVRPTNVQVECYDQQLKLVTSWQNEELSTIILPFFFLSYIFLIFGIITTGLVTKFSVVWLNIAIAILISLLVLSILAGIYFAQATRRNHSTILVANRMLIIKHSPLPWFGNKIIDVENLSQLYAKKNTKTILSALEETSFYDLHAKLNDGRDITLISGLASAEVARFLEQQIESYLGIVDQPIVGEVPK